MIVGYQLGWGVGRLWKLFHLCYVVEAFLRSNDVGGSGFLGVLWPLEVPPVGCILLAEWEGREKGGKRRKKEERGGGGMEKERKEGEKRRENR